MKIDKVFFIINIILYTKKYSSSKNSIELKIL